MWKMGATGIETKATIWGFWIWTRFKTKMFLLNLFLNYFSFEYKTGWYYRAQVALEVMIILMPLPKCCELLHLVELFLFPGWSLMHILQWSSCISILSSWDYMQMLLHLAHLYHIFTPRGTKPLKKICVGDNIFKNLFYSLTLYPDHFPSSTPPTLPLPQIHSSISRKSRPTMDINQT